MVLKLFTTFIVVAAILASPKYRDFTWSYRSSIYRVHWLLHGLNLKLTIAKKCRFYRDPLRKVDYMLNYNSHTINILGHQS